MVSQLDTTTPKRTWPDERDMLSTVLFMLNLVSDLDFHRSQLGLLKNILVIL